VSIFDLMNKVPITAHARVNLWTAIAQKYSKIILKNPVIDKNFILSIYKIFRQLRMGVLRSGNKISAIKFIFKDA